MNRSVRKLQKTKDDAIKNCIKDGDEENVIKKQNEVVVVHATAVIENTPGDKVTQADANNLKNLIFREKHLQENILRLEFGRQQSDVRNLCQRRNCGKDQGPLFGNILVRTNVVKRMVPNLIF